MTQVLYRKWRPTTFDQVVGQEHVTETLLSALVLGRVAHAYLFAGPRGTGKTTTARLLAKAVNCLEEELAGRPCNRCRICRAINEGRFLDLIEIDAASNTGVDDVRDLREKIGFSPNEGRYKVYIVDEVHMLSTAAFNALLKTLEEPPRHAIFVLATTEVNKIPATVISRCQRFDFRRIPVVRMISRLEELLAHEGVEAEPAALDLIARQATGALRDAESLLDQVLSSQAGRVTLQQTQAVLGTVGAETICELVDAWLNADVAAGLLTLQKAVNSGSDPQQLGRQTVDYLRGVLYLKTGGQVPSDVPEALESDLGRHAELIGVGELIRGIRRFGAAAAESRGGWQPQLPLELALVESVSERLAESAEPAKTPEAAAPGGSTGEARPKPMPSERPSAVQQARPVTVAQVESQWGAFLAAVKQRDFRIEAMLRSGQGVLGIEGATVVLGFKYALHREKMESDEWRCVIEDSLADVLGTAVGIRCAEPEAYRPVQPARPDEPAGDAGALDVEEIKRFAVEELNAQVTETGA